jgi:Protein of unknown function (DUF4031)
VILVDGLSHYPAIAARKGLPSEWWCHMMSDQPGAAGEQELIAFAALIGIRARWLQKPGTEWAHFDLMPYVRTIAVRAGAREVTSRELVAGIVARRRAARAIATNTG